MPEYHWIDQPAMHRNPSVGRVRPAHRLGLAVLTVTSAVLAACGGDGAAKKVSEGPPCATADTTAVAAAVYDYIATASPMPQRFLSAVGTDSGLPDDGFKVLQNKGPTYFWSVEKKGQQQVREKLDLAGPYTTLLVIWRGKKEAEDGALVSVTLGGHYINGEHEGKESPTRTIDVRCDANHWKVAGK